jgi:hypothetical protein
MSQRNPHFTALLKRMQEVHDAKSHDYAKDSNVFSNFEIAAYIASLFTDPVDKVFAVHFGTKLSRMAELRNGKCAKNEAIEDTALDLANYTAIWASKLMRDLEILTIGRPTFNHTRGDSKLYPCSICYALMTEEEREKYVNEVPKEKAEVETPASGLGRLASAILNHHNGCLCLDCEKLDTF